MTQTLDSTTTQDTSTETMRAAVVTEFGAPLEISGSRTAHTRLR